MTRFSIAKNLTIAAFISAFTALSPIHAYAQSADDLPSHVTDYALMEAPDDHVTGSEDAAIELIIWASVTCPHCGSWFSEEWPIVKTDLVETDKLRVVFREFPTAPAQMAMTGFLLAECAPSEDYMSIIEYQMENQEAIFDDVREGRGRETYNKIAKLAGMEDNDAISACLRNPDMVSHIQDNSNRASLAKVKGVPAFFINGEAYEGETDAKSLTDLITEMDKRGISTLPKDIKPSSARAGHDHE